MRRQNLIGRSIQTLVNIHITEYIGIHLTYTYKHFRSKWRWIFRILRGVCFTLFNHIAKHTLFWVMLSCSLKVFDQIYCSYIYGSPLRIWWLYGPLEDLSWHIRLNVVGNWERGIMNIITAKSSNIRKFSFCILLCISVITLVFIYVSIIYHSNTI